MKKLLFLSSIVLFLFISCKKEIKYKKTKKGLEYYFYEKSDSGKKGNPGDYYLVEMIGKRSDDSIFINSYEFGNKIKLVRTKPPFHSQFNDALSMLSIGDSVIFRICTDSFFTPLNQSIPKYLKSGELITFTLKVKDILGQQQHLLMMYETELIRMEEYLNKKKWNYQTDTSTGIKYEIINKGNNTQAKDGDEVEISYLLTYLNGKIINRTKPGDNLKFIVGTQEYISALSVLTKLASEGTKLQAVIPFAEGFGENGSAYVDPYATLIIEMEIIKINKK
ncbi:MAG: FKBP-type peptidyl-prolyl cis-trans isomerase [Bacteroidetes bacterium]|nr:FKBP-type peptidyl-prolyl cis-trans isomerase [Bacteroidota bacterium]